MALLALALTLTLGGGARAAAPARSPSPAHDAASRSADPVVSRLAALVAELGRDVSRPRALTTLAELAGLEDELPDLAPLARAYARAANAPTAHPEVRAFARYRLAAVERARGNLRKARDQISRLAFLGGWQIAGPFDNEGKRGFDTPYPPEREQDLAARFPGKAREVGWRALPGEAVVMGFAHLGAAMRPRREVTVYALAVVEAPREERVRLYLGASGATKVFVNGALALADPRYHPARLDQDAVAFTLRKGWNRILLKICHDEGPLGFFARVADQRGEPLPLAELGARPLPAPAEAAAEAPRVVPGVIEALEARARAARPAEAARARYDLAVALAERRAGDDRDRRAAAEARRAVELAPRWLEARLLAARLESDPNRRREQLEAAVAAHGRAAVALTALAQHEMQKGRAVRASELLGRALAAAPRYVTARLALAQLHEGAGLFARARLERKALARQEPLRPGAALAAALDARAQGRLEEAGLLLRKVIALRFDDAGARAALVQLLVDRGDADGAARLLREAIRVDPDDLPSRLRLGDLLAANGRREDAEAAYAAALRLAPEDAEALERRGLARLRAGRTADALADFQAALELKPQNPRLKELVRGIEPARERYEAPYAYDARALARAAPAAEPDEDVVVLGDLEVTKVYPSGLASRFRQLVVKVLTQRGVEAWRSHGVTYSGDRQELRVERARVLKPDGSAVESHQEFDRSASEPWYRLYYDRRARQLGFPALAPGDCLEIAYRTDDVASENLLSDYFGDFVYLGGSARRARSDYVLLVPKGRRIYFSQRGQSGVAHEERTLPGGLVEHRWSARDVPRLRPEPAMPGLSEVLPFVHVSTYRSWDDVARFYWGLVREQLAVTPEVRATALRIAAEVRAERRQGGLAASGDELALVQAVHRFVVTNTRYVGLEFGIHGYKPYRVDQVLDRRFGDCKDKASLAHALLEALGIDSRLVLLRMRRLGRIPAEPASLAVFNHAILYVPRFDLWLDGTASYSGSRDLPGEDRGATVLVVNPGGPARFTTVPEGRPEDNASRSHYDVVLAADGNASVTGEARVSGEQAPAYRRAYATEGDRRARFEQAMSRSFPGLTVKTVAVSDLAHLEDQVTMRFSADLPRLAERDGAGLRLTPFGGNHGYAEALAPLSTRRYELVLGEPWETRVTFRYTLPPGLAASELPAPVRLDLPFAAFDASCRMEGAALVAEARLALRTGRVEPADYPAFRDFLTRVDRALARAVRLAPSTAARR
jgi:tetratricopeptide (TPR) repeat protein